MKKLILPLALIFFCSVLITLSCNDPHKFWKEVPYRFYITASTYDGNLGGIAGADAKCMADANYPGYGTYKAMIVDGVSRIASLLPDVGNGQVDWVLKPNTTYYRSDRVTEVFTTNANSIFVFGTAKNFIDGTITQYWTGFGGTTWIISGANTCTNWIDGTGGSNGGAGQGDQINNRILFAPGTPVCNTFQSLLCVSQTIE